MIVDLRVSGFFLRKNTFVKQIESWIMITELNQTKTPYCSQKLDDDNIDSAFLKQFFYFENC